MKRTLRIAVAIAGIVVLAGLPAHAEKGTNDKEARSTGHDPEAVLERMDKLVSLTPEQREKLKPLFVDARAKLDALRVESALSKDERRAKTREIQKAHQEKVDAILTPEQREKWEKVRAEMRKSGFKKHPADEVKSNPVGDDAVK